MHHPCCVLACVRASAHARASEKFNVFYPSGSRGVLLQEHNEALYFWRPGPLLDNPRCCLTASSDVAALIDNPVGEVPPIASAQR
jgi:hypothetical protein